MTQEYNVWECKIMVAGDAELPDGFDHPPRRAAIEAVEAGGVEVVTCFSGWGGKLDEQESAAMKRTKEAMDRMAVARESRAMLAERKKK